MPSPKSLPSALLGLALACPAMAEEPKGMELGQVLISAEEQSGTDASVAEAQARLAQVPGGSNVVDMRQPLQGRVASNRMCWRISPGFTRSRRATKG